MSELFEHTPKPWDVVAATEHHGYYITTAFGTTVCDLYGMNKPLAWDPNQTPKPISHTDAEKNARAIVTACNAYDDMRKALEFVREIIKDGAMTGFNCHDGDWAERLFASQAATYAALAKALPAPPAQGSTP